MMYMYPECPPYISISRSSALGLPNLIYFLNTESKLLSFPLDLPVIFPAYLRHLPLSFRLCSQFSGSLSGPSDTFAAPSESIFTSFCAVLSLCKHI